jgi:hypothetical protein
MLGTIQYEVRSATMVPDTETTVDFERQAVINRALGPARGTIHGLLASSVLWAVILIPVWFLFHHH